MEISNEQARELAEAAWEHYSLPESLIVGDVEGFETITNGSVMEFSRAFYIEPTEDDLNENEETASSKAYFNAKISLETGELSDVYCITSQGGNLFGSLDEDARDEAYLSAGLKGDSNSLSL